MATYLQGVTDYIPDYQPFQPDYNFYSNLLQAKQTQYDNNWNSLNNLYGQLYGADLTHDLNIKKKDELLKQIDFNLKRVSGLDLSLEQNVNQALQVFRPFYEDRYLIKDMAWTKNWKNEYGRALNLQKSLDEKQRNQYWSVGVRGMELRRQMFKDATLDETLNMGNARYTPKVNDLEVYMDLAKKYDIGAVEQLPDKSGMYLVRKKNGELIVPTLQNMFLAEYANRADIQDMYREMAFVERMNYAEQNAETYGSKLEAEKHYIKEKYTFLKDYVARRNNAAKDDVEHVEKLENKTNEDIKTGNVNPAQGSYLDRLRLAANVNGTVANYTGKLNSQINDREAEPNEKPSDQVEDDILKDIEIARLKIDAGFAAVEAEKKINQAVQSYAFSNAEIEYKPNPYGVERVKHANAVSRMRQATIDKQNELKLKSELEFQKKAADYFLSKNIWSWKLDKDGNPYIDKNPQNNGFGIITGTPEQAGQTTDKKYSLDEAKNMANAEMRKQYGTAAVNELMTTLKNGVDTEKFSAKQLAQLVLLFRPDDPTAKTLYEKGSGGNESLRKQNLKNITAVFNRIYSGYKADNDAWTQRVMETGQIYNANDWMKAWSKKYYGDNLSTAYLSNSKLTVNFNSLAEAEEALNAVENENQIKIKNKFKETLNFYADKAKESGINISKERINSTLDLIMYKYNQEANGNFTLFKEMSGELDDQIAASLGGWYIGKNVTKPRESSAWWEYIVIPGAIRNRPGVYDSKLETVQEDASWTKDILGKAYEDLAAIDERTNPDAALKTNPAIAGKRSGSTISLATRGASMLVMPGVPADPGNKSMIETLRDILSTNFNQKNHGVSLTGTNTPTDKDPTIETSEAMAIIKQLGSSLNTDPELKAFSLEASRIAWENNDLGSMTIRVPLEIVKKVIVGGKEEERNKKIEDIVKNGITFIAPKNTWGNSLFQDALPTPTQRVLDIRPITYDHPMNAGHYKIEKVPGSQSEYRGVVVVNKMMPDGTMQDLDDNGLQDYLATGVNSGRLIDEKKAIWTDMLEKVGDINLKRYKQFYLNNDVKALENANKYFGMTPAKLGFNK